MTDSRATKEQGSPADRNAVDPLFAFIGTVLLAIALTPWAYDELFIKAANHDIIWLVTGLERVLGGQRMTDAAYDPNPPLSFLIYLPVYLAAKIPGMKLEYAIFFTTSLAALLSSALCYALVRKWPFFDRASAWALAVSFLVAGTVAAHPNFGQRDHLLILGLFPLILLQLSRTYGWPVPGAAAWAAMIAGSVLLLLKPHYAVIPAALFLHRMIVQRRLWVIKDADFLCLSLAALTYIALIWVFFRDFATDILPDVLTLYAHAGAGTDVRVIVTLSTVFAAGSILFFVFSRNMDNGKRAFIGRLPVLSIFCLLPYWLMGRGYFYHLLPAFTIFWVFADAAFFIITRRFSGARPALVLTIAALIFGAYFVRPHPAYPGREEIKNLPLTKMVSSCGPDCSFLLMGASVQETQLIQHYAEKPHASRFPKFWFLGYEHAPDEQVAFWHDPAMQEKYTRYVAEDIKKYTPALIIACDKKQSFMKVFTASPAFLEQWRHYSYSGKTGLDKKDYNPVMKSRVKPCDIYRRRTDRG